MTVQDSRDAPNVRVLLVKAALVIPTVVAWTAICLTAYEGASGSGMDSHGSHSPPFAVRETLAMWLVMLVAMMVPVMLPWVRAFARMERGVAAPFFAAGYAAVWLLFAMLATALQWGLSATGVLTPSLLTGNTVVRGVALVLVGAYQWSPLKDSCLTHCESPATFFLARWRDGRRGAFAMGAQHGLYCVGCCWPLMLFMVGIGAMSVTWMAGVTLYTLSEMYVPELRRLSRAAGGALILAGLVSLASGG